MLLQTGRAPHSPRPPGARRGTAVAPTLPSSRRGSRRPPGSSTPSPGAGAARAGGGRGCGGARDASAPAEAQRGGGSAPLGDTRRRDHAPRPPVRTETRACPGARGVRGVPRLERARAGTTQGGRATRRLGSRPSGSRPSLQPHCVHVAQAMGREGPGLPGSRPPDRRLHDPGRAARTAIRTPARVYLEGARTQTGCPRGRRLICPRACVAGAVPGGVGAGQAPQGVMQAARRARAHPGTRTHPVSHGPGTAGPAGSMGGTGRADLPRLPVGRRVLQAVLTRSCVRTRPPTPGPRSPPAF